MAEAWPTKTDHKRQFILKAVNILADNFIMRFLLISIFMFSSFSAFGKRKIIISYFAPFGGKNENHTTAVADLLKNKLSSEEIEIILCPLDGGKKSNGIPTTFHASMEMKDLLKLKGPSAFEKLQECYNNHPDAQQVISLGEGSCQVQVEGVGKNIMKTGDEEVYRDNAGNFLPEAVAINP